MAKFDFFEKTSKDILSLLLKDRTTGKNIIWATDSHSSRGESYAPLNEITVELITGENKNVIVPRVVKSMEEQKERTKNNAEVFTPSWICCQMLNGVDDEWFGRKNIFNKMEGKKWIATENKIEFPPNKYWQEYVLSTRLEATCGEAPYLVSRYDTTTGEFLKTKDRIGIFDRKMRIVSENCQTEDEWLYWSYKALENTYAYEFQGDNLLLARINILLSFAEYMEDKFGRKPTKNEIERAIDIIVWNLWQMDGLYCIVPFSGDNSEYTKLKKLKKNRNLEPNGIKTVIRDWKTNQVGRFYDIGKEEK